MAILVVTYDNTTGGFRVQKVGSAQISDGAILSGKLASGQVGAFHILNENITSAKLTSALIAGIEAGAVGDESITSAKLASGAVIGDRIADDGIFSGKIASGAVGTPQLASGAVTIPKIDDSDPFTIQQTSAPMLKHLLHGYAAGPTYNPIAVDASGYQYFAAVWPDNTVTSSKIASGQVGAPHIYPSAVISSKIGVNAIGAPHILDGAITSGKIASGIVGTVHLRDLNVTSAKLAAALIASIEAGVADGGITSAKIASGAIGGVHIKDGSIPGLDLENQAVTSAKIGATVIGVPHLEQFASGKIIVGQGTGTNPLLRDQLGAIEFIIDGGGSVITSGPKGHLEIPFPANINRVTLLGDQSGNITVDILKDSYSNFPPTAVDSICSGAQPSLSASDRYQDSVLSGWVKSIASGDILAYDANIASNIQRCTVSLGVNK